MCIRDSTNRVQDQLAALGGGGARLITDLEDVALGDVGILTEGYTIGWSTARARFEPSAGGGGVGAAGTWTASLAIGSTTVVGVSTTKNVGIATTAAKVDYALFVGGDALFSGNVTGLGTVTWEDVTKQDVLGLSTLRAG